MTLTLDQPPRAWLFVPADSERKLLKGAESGAEALILDLEDAVAAQQRPLARTMLARYLQEATPAQRAAQQLWVRINPLPDPNLSTVPAALSAAKDHLSAAPAALLDLSAVVAARPDGIVLPKASAPADLHRLHHYLSALEVQAAVPLGSIKTLPVATETAQAVLALPTYAAQQQPLPRLYGMTWGAEDLSAAIGAVSNKTEAGIYADEYRLARALCLMACKAAGVWALGVVYPDFKDLAGLRAEAEKERRAGFAGKIAIHPSQVPLINEAFLPSAEELAHAQRVIAAFAAQEDAGTVALDGQMLDRPHWIQAQRIVALSSRS